MGPEEHSGLRTPRPWRSKHEEFPTDPDPGPGGRHDDPHRLRRAASRWGADRRDPGRGHVRRRRRRPRHHLRRRRQRQRLHRRGRGRRLARLRRLQRRFVVVVRRRHRQLVRDGADELLAGRHRREPVQRRAGRRRRRRDGRRRRCLG